MTCLSSWAYPWQYAAFWCAGSILYGIDNSGGAGNAFLTDTYVNFKNTGVRGSVGMIVYNLTQSTEGYITDVTETTVTAAGVTWDDGDSYRLVTIDRRQQSTIKLYLEQMASRINASLQSVGACNCTLTDDALDFLANINIRLAGIYQECPCGGPSLSIDEKQLYLEDIAGELELIRTGKIELCQGHTGADYPAADYVQHSWTEWNAARLILNRLRSTST